MLQTTDWSEGIVLWLYHHNTRWDRLYKLTHNVHCRMFGVVAFIDQCATTCSGDIFMAEFASHCLNEYHLQKTNKFHQANPCVCFCKLNLYCWFWFPLLLTDAEEIGEIYPHASLICNLLYLTKLYKKYWYYQIYQILEGADIWGKLSFVGDNNCMLWLQSSFANFWLNPTPNIYRQNCRINPVSSLVCGTRNGSKNHLF